VINYYQIMNMSSDLVSLHIIWYTVSS